MFDEVVHVHVHVHVLADLILVISSAWSCVMEHAQNESKWWILYWELLNRPPIHQY